jgi:hypothetical protein
MKWRSRLRALALLASPLLVFGCSRGLDITARAEHGALVFHATGAGWFDFGEAEEEICGFTVLDSLEASRRAETAPPPRLVRQEPGTMWGIEEPMDRAGHICTHMPLAYGHTPPGMIESAPARRLVRGRAYEVYARGPGSIGSGQFRIVGE